MPERHKSSKEVEVVIDDIYRQAGELAGADDVPIDIFRIAHNECFTHQEEAGYITNMIDGGGVVGVDALIEVCERHESKSRKFPKYPEDYPMRRTLGS